MATLDKAAIHDLTQRFKHAAEYLARTIKRELSEVNYSDNARYNEIIGFKARSTSIVDDVNRIIDTDEILNSISIHHLSEDEKEAFKKSVKCDGTLPHVYEIVGTFFATQDAHNGNVVYDENAREDVKTISKIYSKLMDEHIRCKLDEVAEDLNRAGKLHAEDRIYHLCRFLIKNNISIFEVNDPNPWFHLMMRLDPEFNSIYGSEV